MITREQIAEAKLLELSALVGEGRPKVHDFPTADHVKLYYDHATLLADLPGKTATYERVRRRPLVFHSNVLHRNSLKGWKWASDIFALLLIFFTVSGWFMLKGRNGVSGRGKWFIAAGFVPPIAAIILFEFLQQ